MFGINPIEMFFIFLVVLPFLLLAVGVIKGLRDESSRARLYSNPEEVRMIQQIYEDLQRMEKRMEALETILLDRAREAEKEERFR
jgi:hypothetical protein